MTKPPNSRDATPASGRPTKADATVFELNPEIQPGRWESLVARINEQARPILEARRQQSLTATLMGWRRPVMTGAASLAAAAALVWLLLPVDGGEPVEATLAEAMVPWSVAAWMDGSYAPTVAELVLAVEEYTP